MAGTVLAWNWTSDDLDALIKFWPAAGYFDTTQAMSPAVRAIGAGWLDNYNSQGKRVGGWKPLKPYTQRERELRGYKPDRPVLFQSGALEAGAIRPFASWGDTQTKHSAQIAATPGSRAGSAMVWGGSDEYVDSGTRQSKHVGWQAGGTRVAASVTPRRFFANISGTKAMNQTGGSIPVASKAGFTKLPARPFWFFDERMLDDAANIILGRFQYYSFRYFPRVSGVNVGWQGSLGTPSKPSAAQGPTPGLLLKNGNFQRS